MLLSSRLGLALYTLLPHHWGWALLTRVERAQLREGNRYHDTTRADYAEPERYQGGGFGSRPAHRGRAMSQVIDFLYAVRPQSVFEVGPGAGCLTRLIATHPDVRRFVCVDVNVAFADYLRKLLAFKDEISVDVVAGQVADVPPEQFDAIIAVSTVHHIPDRPALFRALAERLKPGGRILCIDPAYSLLQVRKMWRKMRQPGRLAAQLGELQAGRYGTHAMCTESEYQELADASGLRVVRVDYGDYPRRLQGWRWFAQEIRVELERYL